MMQKNVLRIIILFFLVSNSAKSQGNSFSSYTTNCFLLDSLNKDSIKNDKEISACKKKINAFVCKHSTTILLDSVYQKYSYIKSQFEKRMYTSSSLRSIQCQLSNNIKNDTMNLKIDCLLFDISTHLKLDSISDNFFLNSLTHKNDDLDVFSTFLWNCNPINKDSVHHIFNCLNQNYALNNLHNLNFNLDIYFRSIWFYDQVPRILSRKRKKSTYYDENITDSYVQNLFTFVANNYDIFSGIYPSRYNKEIQLVLLHASVTNLKFVESYFKNYFKTFNYDYTIFESPKFITDMYLKFKYHKQFFGTTRDLDENKKIISLPKISKEEFKEIMRTNFKIENPIF